MFAYVLILSFFILFHSFLISNYYNLINNDDELFRHCLAEPGPDVVVCDEGHLLKNNKTSLSDAFDQIRTKRRIALTGTPLQNHLREYFCMVDFVKPCLLGNLKEFSNMFANPIANGQYRNSERKDIEIMQRRSHVLHKLKKGVFNVSMNQCCGHCFHQNPNT